MAPTVRTLLDHPDLHVRLLVGDDRQDTQINWVHVSELPDPVPFLQGGELVLTTGIEMSPRFGFRPYVRRLADGGVVGVGFGVQPVWDHVPRQLIDAARQTGLVLLEVPARTPFIAVTRAHAQAAAPAEHQATLQLQEAQRRLTRAATIEPDPSAVVRQLARHLDSWALLVNREGRVLHATQGAQVRTAGLRDEIAKLHVGTVDSAAINDGSQHVILQAVGVERHAVAVLVLGRGQPWTAHHRTLLSTGVSLLGLLLGRMEAVEARERPLRNTLLGLLITEASGQVWSLATQAWGLPDVDQWVVLRAEPAISTTLVPSPRQRAESAWRHHGEGLLGTIGERITYLLPASANVDELSHALVRAGFAVGSGNPASRSQLRDSLCQADQALRWAQQSHPPAQHFAAARHEHLSGTVDTAAADEFVRALLAPLEQLPLADKNLLLRSLFVWLAHNGVTDRAARKLGIHRHTMTKRIERIERLLNRDLSSPTTRMELWFSLTWRRDETTPPAL